METLKKLGIEASNPGTYASGWRPGEGRTLTSLNPATGEPLGRISCSSEADFVAAIETVQRGTFCERGQFNRHPALRRRDNANPKETRFHG